MPSLIFGAMLLITQLLPSLPFYFGVAPSMALGMTLAAAICGLLVLAHWAIRSRSVGLGIGDASVGGIALIGAVLFIVVLHGLVADVLQPLDSGRFIASLIPLVLLLAGGLALAAAIRAASPSQITSVTRISFCVLCVILVFKEIGLQPPHGGRFPKSTFPFTETSHFALAFSPVFLFRCAVARSANRNVNVWVLFGLVLAIILKSATLLAVACIAALICRRLLIVLLAAALVAAGGLSVNTKYFTSRADISNSSSNLSALVYLEGWEMLGDSLQRSDGWGIGFQQLGVRGSNVPAAEAIRKFTSGEDLNLEDGGFVLAKLGSELGALGVILVAAYVVLALRCLRALRVGSGPINGMFARCIIVAYGVDMFARGTGYFSQSTLLFVAGLLALAPVGGLLRAGYGPNSERLLVFR